MHKRQKYIGLIMFIILIYGGEQLHIIHIVVHYCFSNYSLCMSEYETHGFPEIPITSIMNILNIVTIWNHNNPLILYNKNFAKKNMTINNTFTIHTDVKHVKLLTLSTLLLGYHGTKQIFQKPFRTFISKCQG